VAELASTSFSQNISFRLIMSSRLISSVSVAAKGCSYERVFSIVGILVHHYLS
jgi:hypothetical protein